ncbi:recombinase family protein [Streptococcus gordonii]|uniref:recombinase family protein n=1 Tax=Streptococcus gordonii TaxID=1302 RepID=UPI001D13F3DC|nr:recombinase family protein [Streptococcus gordonii]
MIYESEAKIVRFIYDSYIDGMSVREIVESLMDSHIPTVIGLDNWSNLAIYNILKNEKYKGEIII